MREAATTLTDFVLAALSLSYALGMIRQPGAPRNWGPLMFFTGFGLAALFGGLWHGFFSAPGASGERFLWWLSMLLAGLSAIGLAAIGAELLGLRNKAVLLAGALLSLLPFGIYVWFDPRFLATLVVTAAGTLICVAGLLSRFRDARSAVLMALAGLAISAAAAVAQQRGIAIHPAHFDHNATYHLFIIPALGLFHAGLRRLMP